MKMRNMVLIARKDLTEVLRNKAAVIPMIVLPLIFVILMPVIMIVAMQSSPQTAQAMTADPDIQVFLTNLPEATQVNLAGMTGEQSALVLVLGMMMAPMFLILPLMFASIIAAESFAGEFERKTMEALLYTPASDWELFFGKVLAGFLPSVLITWVSFLVYTIILNWLSFPIFHSIWFPLDSWWPLIFWVSPAISLMSVSFTVLISAKLKNFMGTYQMSGSLVLIVVALFIGQMTGLIYLSVLVGIIVGFICWIFAAVFLYMAVHFFNRQKLLLDII
ncbi:MAG: ABC transporter permease subunit [Anaerolineaceae bacterium]|nr:ABC transporter permease subunit [Anaerolineaceae bacterium]